MNMNVEELRHSGRIVFECVSGSHAYGTNIPSSDIDIRGFYVNPIDDYLGLTEPAPQIGDDKHDTTYYSLKRAFELLATANPNMIELLWMPDESIKMRSTVMDKLISCRDMFISKKCFHTHSGYAYAQIKKAKGQNKKVHNPQSEEMPVKENFCWVIPSETMGGYRDEIMPMRPREIANVDPYDIGDYAYGSYGGKVDLSHYHAAAVEHTHEMYRIYYYGDDAKGVFRGDDMLVCESIPIEDEVDRFAGVLIYSKDSYDRAVKDWHSYWDWKNNRNDARWIDQEKGTLNYDQKNMMHCMRLLISGESILTNGFPIVRFEGEWQEYLMKIRNGEFEYEELMASVEDRMAKLESLYETSSIPHKVDEVKIDALYRGLSK